MSSHLVAMCFLVGLVVLYLLIRQQCAFDRKNGDIPNELRPRKIVMAEQDMHTDTRIGRIHGRPDVVYEDANGLCIPVELKTRDYFAVFDVDVAELSLQAWMLRREGRATSNFAFVKVQLRKTNKLKWIKVWLMNDEACHALLNRYHALESGADLPKKNAGSKCKSCGHLKSCLPSAPTPQHFA